MIPTATRTVSAGDFDVTADDFDLMEKTVEIVTEGGIQTVYLTLTGSVVYYSSYFNNCNYNMPAQYWSDNQTVHNTADYLIGYDVSADCTFIRGVEGVPFGGRDCPIVGRICMDQCMSDVTGTAARDQADLIVVDVLFLNDLELFDEFELRMRLGKAVAHIVDEGFRGVHYLFHKQ